MLSTVNDRDGLTCLISYPHQLTILTDNFTSHWSRGGHKHQKVFMLIVALHCMSYRPH